MDEVTHSSAVAIVDTPTPPTGLGRIDLSRWEDLLHAAELLGRPILRLEGGEGGPERHLFYVADGAQSYVFGFHSDSVNVTRSGAYARPAPPVPVPVPAPPPAAPVEVARTEVTQVTRAVARPPVIQPLPLPTIPPPVVPEPADATWSPEVSEQLEDTELPSATVVERRIREMIHELLTDFRKLPPTSDRLELGTEHIQRAIDMLHLGRYGVAQIELKKAAGLLRDEPVS
ncbi:MAG: hypothetical protein WA688_02100 [Thermoplasmata archaeon]